MKNTKPIFMLFFAFLTQSDAFAQNVNTVGAEQQQWVQYNQDVALIEATTAIGGNALLWSALTKSTKAEWQKVLPDEMLKLSKANWNLSQAEEALYDAQTDLKSLQKSFSKQLNGYYARYRLPGETILDVTEYRFTEPNPDAAEETKKLIDAKKIEIGNAKAELKKMSGNLKTVEAEIRAAQAELISGARATSSEGRYIRDVLKNFKLFRGIGTLAGSAMLIDVARRIYFLVDNKGKLTKGIAPINF